MHFAVTHAHIKVYRMNKYQIIIKVQQVSILVKNVHLQCVEGLAKI